MLKLYSLQSQLPRPKSANLFLTLHSQDVISLFIDDTPSHKTININQSSVALTNSDLDNKKTSENGFKSQKKNGNKAVKKLGGTLFNLFHHQKRMENNKVDLEYASIKQKIKESSNKLLKSKHKPTRSEILEVRSMQLDEQLRAIHTHRGDEKIEKIEKNNNNSNFDQKHLQQFSATQFNPAPQPTTRRSSQNMHINLQSSKTEQPKQNAKNGFYNKLKIKLQRQMEKIEAKKRQRKDNLLVEGCKILKFDNQMEISRKPLTDRPRPQSSLTRTGLEFQTSQYIDKDRRPKTSRSRTVQRKEIEYMSATADDILNKKPKARPKTSRDNLARKGEYHLQSAKHKTLKHVNPIHLSQNHSVTRNEIRNEKLKEKMLTLLVECDHQTTSYNELNSGLRVFESYTNRMNKGLSQVSKILEDVQNIDYI